MKGLWSFQSKLVGHQFHDQNAVARIALNIIFFVALLFVFPHQPNGSRLSQSIKSGTYALLIFYVLLIVSLFLHESRVKVPLAFVLYDWFAEAARVTSNVWITAGVHDVVVRTLIWRWPSAKWFAVVGDCFILVVQLMGLYYLGGLLAGQVLWLQVAEVSTVETISNQKDQFGAALSALIFVLAFYVLLEALAGLFGHLQAEKNVKDIPKYHYFSIGASVALWARSISELVVEVRYHLERHQPRANTLLARDTVFGLFTLISLYLIVRAFWNSSTIIDCPTLLLGMKEDVRHDIVNAARAAIEVGRVAPPVASSLNRVRQRGMNAFSKDVNDALNKLPTVEATELMQGLFLYLDELDMKYGKLEGWNPAREC